MENKRKMKDSIWMEERKKCDKVNIYRKPRKEVDNNKNKRI